MSASTVFTVKADLTELARLGEAIAAFGRQHALPSKVVFDLTLALDEVFTNITSYAFDERADHDVRIRLTAAQLSVLVDVEDDGRPFNPLDTAPPDLAAALTERAVGGLGVHLLRSVMSDVRYERRDGRNHLRMRRDFAPAPGDPLPIAESNDHGVVVVAVSGRLDATTSPALGQRLLALIEAGEHRLVIDLAHTDYISSAGLHVLLIAAKRLATTGRVVLAAPPAVVREILDIAGFSSIVPICATRADAVAAARS